MSAYLQDVCCWSAGLLLAQRPGGTHTRHTSGLQTHEHLQQHSPALWEVRMSMSDVTKIAAMVLAHLQLRLTPAHGLDDPYLVPEVPGASALAPGLRSAGSA